MLRYGAEQPQIDLFNPGIIRHINIASKAVQNVIGKNDGTGGAQVSSAIMTLKNRQVVEDVIHFRKIVLSPDWNNNVLNQYYLNNTATRNLFPANLLHRLLLTWCSMVTMPVSSRTVNILVRNGLTWLWLHIFVIYVLPRVFFIALKDKNVLPYIKNAVGRIVDLGLLVNIPVLSFVKGQYDVIKEATNATSLLIFVRECQKALSEKIIESDVNAMGPVFLHDVYQSGEQFDILKKKLNALACGVFSSSERLIECFTVLPVNMRFILEQMQLQGQHIRMEGSVGIFASWFRDAEPDVVTNAEETFIFCGLASTIPRERLYLLSCTMSYLKDIFVLTAVLRLLPVFIMSCRLLNLRRPLNAGLLRRCLALLLIMYYCLNGLTVRRFHFHHGLRRTPVRQRVV
ncbi:hypothetical protein [Enterobacter cloacae complex sp. 403K5]|uniref:hypothetical protein n=1 Tax=Enterobacter cloacae complex sp. 403K5 TaxID=3395854 RepID=UPI003CF88B2F